MNFSLEIFSLEAQARSVDLSTSTYNFDYEDERRALREELERFRRENETLRRTLQMARSSTHEQGQTLPPSTSTSIDSALDTSLSSTLKSATALQLEVKELREREGKLYEQIQSLRQVRRKSLRQNIRSFANVFKATSINVFTAVVQ